MPRPLSAPAVRLEGQINPTLLCSRCSVGDLPPLASRPTPHHGWPGRSAHPIRGPAPTSRKQALLQGTFLPLRGESLHARLTDQPIPPNPPPGLARRLSSHRPPLVETTTEATRPDGTLIAEAKAVNMEV